MNRMAVYVMLVVLTALLSPFISAYDEYYPINIEDRYYDEHEPKLLEGKDITNSDGDCVYIKGTEWVVIRGNYIHGCKPSNNKSSKGRAIYIEKAENVIIENNRFEKNHKGIILKKVKNVVLKNNSQVMPFSGVGIYVEKSIDVKILGSELFARVPGDDGVRMIRTNEVEISDNNFIDLDSSIKIFGATIDLPKLRSYNITINKNTFVNVGSAVQLDGIQKGNISNNLVNGTLMKETSESIVLNYDTKRVNVFNNEILKSNCGVVLRNSPENVINNNTFRFNKVAICLDGETLSDARYEFIGAMNNKIMQNLFKNNSINIQILSGANDGTTIENNLFDVLEVEVVFADNQSLKKELKFSGNQFKKEPLLLANNSINKSQQNENKTRKTLSETIEIIRLNPVLIYALLTLVFVLLVVGGLLFGTRQGKK